MRGLPIALAWFGMFAAPALLAQTPVSEPGLRAPAVTVTSIRQQRAAVEQLKHAVASKEAGSRAAAAQLQQKDATIAELQRQLQVVKPVPMPATKGR